MLHALNPYGFSHLRRVNEDNADLNRNFVDFRAPLPVNAAYAEIHSLLLPAIVAAAARQRDAARRLGRRARRQARIRRRSAAASTDIADGMFYGGAGPPGATATLRAVLREHAASRSALGWIDFHTGLGPRGHGEKIYAGGNDRRRHRPHQGWWGDDVTVVLRRHVDLGAADRRQRLRGVRRVSERRLRRHRARIRHLSDRADAAGASRRALAAQSSGRARRARARNQARASATCSTSMPTTGRQWSTRRRSTPA